MSTSKQSFGEIELCALTVGAKIWCLFFNCRISAGIKFTHRPKIRSFALQGRLVAPIHVKLGRANGHLGPLGCAKFHLNRRRGGNTAPKISKISTFW